ncbi:bifunctional 3-(3-hydroxy-phenyl)propionate/3-hydroxycinnamic acid hydroxylase [Amycolatopsis mongoliensis]|uniref:Bifunctional 3-(3-hydroxy-phenyl)propionate/3-hydroxycinnamic acid hydroxylase n=1 Tax=Amycolatopsis mongoliensis TaxID=715475 RepID=A0A9Y2JPF5_9PSEU|nr:bifunctional 3-(3-hydroxy-phenyl)propionate/3-hydroxycinnamic acid hydroxylase [Amycolatopsis sp. 4-36]WIY01089.1 bifunctional 3-(3-hydroxy-phenyl)propionate/3-hydroxycinnamic acid hydroxylase [Amycolatopsis sp. 4-36]
MSDPELHDVIVVGMGPVGSAAAIFAARAGLRVCALDKSADVYPLPRATHFDAEIMRLFQRAGLTTEVGPVVRTYDGGVHLGVDGEPIRDFRVRAERGPLGWYPHYTFLQPELDRVLRDQAAAVPGVACRTGAEVVDVRDTGSDVEVDVDVDGRTETLRARYVIACDGASSPIRKRLGIRLDDYGFDERWIIVDVRVPHPEVLPEYSVMWCDPSRPATYIPQPGRNRRWEFMLLDGESAEEMTRRDSIDRLLKPSVDPTGVEIVRSAVYRFHGLIAESWRSGRVFLAGDAAHQTPPFYGQGMCHGIRDVSNLAWKLALAVRDTRFEPALDSYAEERRPHVKTIIDASVENGRYICILDRDEALERDRRLRERLAAGTDVRSFRSVIPGLAAGVLSAAETAERGQLMIQPTVKTADGRDVLLDEQLGSGFAVLVAGDAPPSARTAWFTDVLGGRIVRVVADPSGPGEIADPTGALAAWFAGAAAGAVLVRPDGYVFGTVPDGPGIHRLIDELASQLSSVPIR